MKKLSVLCILLILCSILASCANLIDANAGNTAGADADSAPVSTDLPTVPEATAPVAQTTEIPEVFFPEAEITVPLGEKREVTYDIMPGCGVPDYISPVSNILYWHNYYKENNLSHAVCLVTVVSIDYSQITDISDCPLVELYVHKIYEKTSAFSVSKGSIVTATDHTSGYRDPDGTIVVSIGTYGLPVAEVGEQYIVQLIHDYDDFYDVRGLTVPLPSRADDDAAFYREQYEKLHLDDLLFSDSVFLCETALIHWYYNDTVPDYLLGLWARWTGSTNKSPADPTLSADAFRTVKPGTAVLGFLNRFGLPYKIELGEGSSTGYYKTAEGDTVLVKTDIDFVQGNQFGNNSILDVSFAEG